MRVQKEKVVCISAVMACSLMSFAQAKTGQASTTGTCSPAITGDRNTVTLNCPTSRTSSSFLEIVKSDFASPAVLSPGIRLAVNVGFAEKGDRPIKNLYLNVLAPTIEFAPIIEDKNEKDAERATWKTFASQVSKDRKRRKRDGVKGLAQLGNTGMAWTTTYSPEITEKQIPEFVSGMTRLYLFTWEEWYDSEGRIDNYKSCQWLQAPPGPDLSKRENVTWHVCRFIP